MFSRIGYTVGYMAWQVALKGGLSGALWVMFWMWVDQMDYGTMQLEDVLAVGGAGLFGIVFGTVMGAMLGVAIGIVYTVINAIFLRTHTPLTAYRRRLMIAGGVLGFGAFFWMLGGLELSGGWTGFSGAILAAAGVAVSTYAYVPAYVHRFIRDEYGYKLH